MSSGAARPKSYEVYPRTMSRLSTAWGTRRVCACGREYVELAAYGRCLVCREAERLGTQTQKGRST